MGMMWASKSAVQICQNVQRPTSALLRGTPCTLQVRMCRRAVALKELLGGELHTEMLQALSEISSMIADAVTLFRQCCAP